MKAHNKRVVKTLTFTKNAAVIGAAVGSIPVVYIVSRGAILNYTGIGWLSSIAGVLAVILFASVVEYGMKVYFPYGINGVLSGKAFKSDWRQATLISIILGLGLAMMFASGYMSFEGRKEAANLVAGDVSTANIDQVAESVAGKEEKLLQVAQTEKQAIQDQIQARQDEIRLSQSSLSALIADGNNWASRKMQSIIDSDRKLKQLENQLAAQQTTISNLLNNSTVSKAVETTAKENELKLMVWEQRRNTSAGLVGVFGIACIIIFAFSATTLELFQIVEETSGKRPAAVRAYAKSVSTSVPIVTDTTIEEIQATQPKAVRSRPQSTRNRSEKPNSSGTVKRICQNDTCSNDLDVLGKRRDAKFCSSKCRKHHHEHKETA